MSTDVKVWRNRTDVADAADALVERIRDLEVPTWSTRALQLEHAVSSESRVIEALGWAHPLAIAFLDELRRRLGFRAYHELWTAMSNAERSRRSSRLFPRRPEHPAD